MTRRELETEYTRMARDFSVEFEMRTMVRIFKINDECKLLELDLDNRSIGDMIKNAEQSYARSYIKGDPVAVIKQGPTRWLTWEPLQLALSGST
jgi:hypothetical protein